MTDCDGRRICRCGAASVDHLDVADADSWLAPIYRCSHCGDEYIYRVSVQFDGSVLTTLVSECGDPPDGLQALIDALQQIVGRPRP